MPHKRAIPINRTRSAVKYRREALTRLKERWGGDGEFDPSGQPTVTPALQSAEGGLPHILEALRAHSDEDAREFIELYDSLTLRDRKYLTLEEVAYACGIGSLRLAEVATSAMILYGQMTSKIMLAAGLPGIVQTSVRLAKTDKGGFDREMMLKAGGVLPVPKGNTFVFPPREIEDRGPKTIEAEPEYLDAGERLRLIHDAVDPKRLPSPPSTPVDIGGRLAHIQDETAEVLAGE